MDTTTFEKAILGYMLLDNTLDSALLSEREFQSDNNRLIFRAIQELKKQGEVFDLVVLTAKLKGDVEPSDISSLLDGLPKGRDSGLTESYFKNYVNQLIKANKEHEVKKLITEAATEPSFLPRLQRILEEYEIEAAEPIEGFTMSAHTDSLRDYINKRRSGEIWGLKVKSFPRLTFLLMGLREIIVLVADAKVGKSTFALQAASEVADQGAGVVYYDFENGRLNLMTRELCRKYDIQYRSQLLNDDYMENDRITQGLDKIKERKNFAIITDRKLTIEKMRSQIFQMRKLTEQDHVFMVVDSLQKLPMKDLRERRAAVDRWLRDFEELKAEDPYLTILMISELSRAGQPKESGDIEYTGHFQLKLERNIDKGDVPDLEQKFPSGEVDDLVRVLTIQYARDVQAGAKIKYQADFSRWKFAELKKEEEAFS